jgi:hypothetical protein
MRAKVEFDCGIIKSSSALFNKKRHPKVALASCLQRFYNSLKYFIISFLLVIGISLSSFPKTN